MIDETPSPRFPVTALPLIRTMSRHDYERYSALIDEYCNTSDRFDGEAMLERLSGLEGHFADYLRSMVAWEIPTVNHYPWLIRAAKAGLPGAVCTLFKSLFFGWCEHAGISFDVLAYTVYQVAKEEGTVWRASRRILLGLDKSGGAWEPPFEVDKYWLRHEANVLRGSYELKIGGSYISCLTAGKKTYARYEYVLWQVLSTKVMTTMKSNVGEQFLLNISSSGITYLDDLITGATFRIDRDEVQRTLSDQVPLEKLLRDMMFYGVTVTE
jgi:hypothetical protein